MATQTGSISFEATGGFSSYASGRYATGERMRAAETAIEQTANNVLIKATETDTTDAQGGQHLIQSLINVAPQGVKIAADKVNIEGAAIFASGGRLSESSLNDTYAGKTAAATATQLIYLQQPEGTTASGLSPAKPTTTWITDSTGISVIRQGIGEDEEITGYKWTSVRPQYVMDAPLIFVAQQTRFADDHVTTGDAHLDETTTVIDGAHIITGSIDANRIFIQEEAEVAAGSLSFYVGNAQDRLDAVEKDKADASALETVSTIATGNSEDLNNLKAMVNVTSHDGVPELTLGSQGTATENVRAVMTNSELLFKAFHDGTWDDVMSLGAYENEDGEWESLMRIMKAVVLRELRFGDFAFISRENGNVSLKWMGA